MRTPCTSSKCIRKRGVACTGFSKYFGTSCTVGSQISKSNSKDVIQNGTPDCRVPYKNGENETSGCARHPAVLCVQSEGSVPILVYSVIGQILTGDTQFYNTMFLFHFKYMFVCIISYIALLINISICSIDPHIP